MLMIVPLTCFPNRRGRPSGRLLPPGHTYPSWKYFQSTSEVLAKYNQPLLVCKGDCAIGHVVVPLQLSSAVFCLVELLYLHGNKF